MNQASARRLIVSLLFAALLATPSPGTDPEWLEDVVAIQSLDIPQTDPSLPSPADHLGYPLGHRFTRHAEILDYLRALALRSERVTLWEYGRSYEDRPLVLVAVSSAENIAQLEELRSRQAATALRSSESGSGSKRDGAESPIFAWMAYGIHGNEASSSETAMAAAFTLAAARGDWADRLEKIVVLIDPTVNPDGRERYVHWYQSTRGETPDSYQGAAEHAEPWPGGRQNHYLIDLNRDWTWLTQRETARRLEEYRRWEPHLYVDFHEMSSQSTYFFPPSTEPIHPGIEASTVGWLDVFGVANARAFDRLGWTYYVAENFDLFYPGYSDSYPSLRGAIGMTYEMAGHGRAGLVLERPDGSRLTLADRIARHLTTTLATLKTAAAHQEQIAADFVAARQRATSREGRTYLWRVGQGESGTATRLFEAHGLVVERLAESRAIETRRVGEMDNARRNFDAGTYLLYTAQPLGALAETLIEPDTAMPAEFLAEQRRRIEDNLSPEFFDITAWSVPLAFNLETFIAEGRISGKVPVGESNPVMSGEGELGFLVHPQGLDWYRFSSSLLAHGINTRLTLSRFERNGRSFPRGTLFVPRLGNPPGLEKLLLELAEPFSIEISRVASGLSEAGVSLGSDDVVPVRRPNVALVGGPGVSPTSFGFVWFLLDQELAMPYSRITLDSIADLDLTDFDVLILPDGRGYASRLTDDAAARIGRWVDDGGTLISIGGAVDWLRQVDLTSIENWPEDPAEDAAGPEKSPDPPSQSLYTPGAALRASARASHALTVGTGSSLHVPFRGRTVLRPTGDPRQDIVVADSEQPVVAGFAWPEAEERLRGALLVGAERKNAGTVVVFAQDPYFRLFWRASAPPFLNALLFAPSLRDYGRLFE